MSPRAKKPNPPAPPGRMFDKRVSLQQKAEARINELKQLKIRFLAEMSITKDRLETLNTNIDALEGGIAELSKLIQVAEESGDG